MFQIQSIYSENAYGPVTNLARGRSPKVATTDLQQFVFAELFEDAFRGKIRKVFRFCFLKFTQKKLPKYRVKRSKK